MLNYVPPDQLGAKWEFVEKGLLKVLERCPDTWTPWIVRQRLLDGRATLFASDEGFFVTEVLVDQHNLQRRLNVWCLYFLPGFGRKHLHELVEQIDQIEKHNLCDTSQFGSPRSPWVRALAKYYEPFITIYRRKKQ